MRKLQLLSVLIVVIGGLCVSANANIVLNPGFEDDLTGWSASGKVTVDTVIYHGGLKSALTTMNVGDVGWDGPWQVIEGISSNQSYFIETWIKFENVSQTHFKVDWFDGNNAWLKSDYILGGTNGTADWFSTSDTLTSPATAVKLTLLPMGGQSLDGENPGKTWVDDFNVVPEPATMGLLLLGVPLALRRRRK